jgi:putative phosphoribosyl transferase
MQRAARAFRDRREAGRLDVLGVRKLGVPGHEELAMGAIASGGAYSLDEELILGLGPEEMRGVIETEQCELKRRETACRNHHEFPDVKSKTVILVAQTQLRRLAR